MSSMVPEWGTHANGRWVRVDIVKESRRLFVRRGAMLVERHHSLALDGVTRCRANGTSMPCRPDREVCTRARSADRPSEARAHAPRSVTPIPGENDALTVSQDQVSRFRSWRCREPAIVSPPRS